MLWIDIKYANLLSSRLGGYKLKKSSPYLANFRCHYCGDSEANKNKKRGYLIEKKGSIYYHCHNCGVSHSFWKVLKDIDPILHQEYSLDKLREGGHQTNTQRITAAATVALPSTWTADISKFGKQRHQKWEHLKKLKKVSSLPVDHLCKQYIMSRQIPPEQHYRLFYVEKFYEWVNAFIPDKFDNNSLRMDGPRLVIPFLSKEGRLFAFQGRALTPVANKVKYISIVLDDSLPRVFGLDKLDTTKDIFVLEGPIDSLFVPNSIAMAGGENADVNKVASNDKLIMVFDNEPRSVDTIKRMEKQINAGRRIVIWPETIQEKDVNDMILAGKCKEEISNIMHQNTFGGMAATVRLSEWRKV